jgi:hypothetical protein
MPWRAATAAIPPRSRRSSARACSRVPGPDLDLRAQKFGAHLGPQQCLEFGQHAVGWVAHNIARRPIDEEILLLDAERKFPPRVQHLAVT